MFIYAVDRVEMQRNKKAKRSCELNLLCGRFAAVFRMFVMIGLHDKSIWVDKKGWHDKNGDTKI